MSSKWTDEKIKNGILSVMKENGMKAMPTASDYDGLGVEDLKLMAKEYGVEIEEKKQDD